MNKLYLVIDGTQILVFFNEFKMKAAGYTKADKIVTENEYNSNGCYARIIDGDIVIGLTESEKQAQSIADQVAEIDSQLTALDNKYLTPRVLSGIALGDEYAINSANQHEAQAALLRAKREALLITT